MKTIFVLFVNIIFKKKAIISKTGRPYFKKACFIVMQIVSIYTNLAIHLSLRKNIIRSILRSIPHNIVKMEQTNMRNAICIGLCNLCVGSVVGCEMERCIIVGFRIF